MRQLLLALAVSLGLASCQQEVVSVIDLSEADWKWSSPDSSAIRPFDACIPGHVLEALVEADLAPNPYLGTHERDVQWVEILPWHLQTHLPNTGVATDSAVLCLEGIDTYASVFVNDVQVLSANNTHRSWTTSPFPVTENGWTIELRFAPVAARGQLALDAHGLVVPASNEAKPLGTQTSPMTRKPGYQFGWDWGPRLAGPGISGPMHLRPWNPEATEAPAPPVCAVLHVDSSLARVTVRRHKGWTLDITLEGQDVPYTWTGNEVRLEQPAMWWPADMGAHPLYEWTWTHLPSGTVHRHVLGMRMLKWVEQSDGWGTSFQLEVNGIPVQVRGANVVPPDFHQTQDAERWKTLAKQARDANMNMVRVWGGGVYPPDAFFESCDEQGLLVWQDFMFACAMVPDDSAFTENVKREAEEHVRRLTHHPSLALWCGNNEVERAWQSWGWQDMYDLQGPDSVRLAAAYHKMFYEVLPQVVSQESDAFYLPTSPTLDGRSGDEHAWGVWFGLNDFSYYSRHNGRFASEYGLQSLPSRHTLEEAGIDAFTDEALQFRQRSRMDWLEPGFDGWDMMHHFMSKTTGAPAPEDLDDWIFKSQWTQAEGLRQALERHRTSEGRYAGSLYWSLNDVWPAVSWSTVDHAGRWKLAHFAAQRANSPRTALWVRQREDSLFFVLFNDLPQGTSGTLQVATKDFEGCVVHETLVSLDISARRSLLLNLGEMDVWRGQPFDTYLSWQWQDSTEVWSSSSSALWCAPVEARLPEPFVQCTPTGGGFELSANTYVPLVQLTASVPGHWSDNGMALEPGQTCVVQFTPEAPIATADIHVVVRCQTSVPQ